MSTNFRVEKDRVVLPCDCGCCVMVVERSKWDDGEEYFSISIQDSYYQDVNGVIPRLKRAFRALFGKHIWFNDVSVDGRENFKAFVDELGRLCEPETKK